MDREPQPEPVEEGGFPKIDIFPLINQTMVMVRRAGRFVAYHVLHEPPAYQSDHYRSAAATLDSELYDEDSSGR